MNLPFSFRHILVVEDQKARRIVALEEPIYGIGRESKNDIVIYDRIVSRRHATLVRLKATKQGEQDSYEIIDGDLEGNRSTNGLTINGRSRKSHHLNHGDVIVFSPQSKASYYILSTGLEIDLFNPISLETLKGTQTKLTDHNYKSTLITDESLQNSDRDNLVRLASFPELSPNPIIEIDFVGNLTYLNPAASLKFPRILEEKLQHPALMGLVSESSNIHGNLFLREVQVGSEIFEQYVHYLSDSQLIRSYLFDVTDRKKAEKTLEYRAMHDALTNLPNRTRFDEELRKAIEKARQNNHLMAILFLDLDEFKNINDTLGHPIGDQLLKSFGDRLNTCVRTGDLVARWGGDEFTLLLPHIKTPEDTVNLAKRIIDGLKEPFDISRHQLHVKTSIGIAIYPQDGEDGETLLKNADAALYRAKERGRNDYRFYSSTMTSKASFLLKLEERIAQALEEETFRLHYQPQLNLVTSQVSGMESLVSWDAPELGYDSSVPLMPLLENTHFIAPVSLWILRTVCQQSRTWQQGGLWKVPMAVNVTAGQFQEPTLVTMVDQVLGETGLDPQLLTLEIPETVIMENVNFSQEILEKLRNLGVNISLDHFGTGYSSLSYLSKLPINALKIAPAFIQSLQDNSKDMAIVSMMISLGKKFDLKAIAQGVETLQQLELLQQLQCEEAQGDWLSHPLSPEEATLFLKNKQ